MNKRARTMGAFAFLMCLVVVGGMLVYYQYMRREKKAASEKTPTTEVEKLLAKDMEVGYPETPKAVMDLYCRITQCMYKGGLADDQFDGLLDQLRWLYSSDLLTNNSKEQQLQQMKEEIKSFKEESRSILSYTIDTSSVEYKTVNNRECAVITIAFFLRQKGDYSKTYEEFMLAKEESQWKILGFQQVKSSKDGEIKEGE